MTGLAILLPLPCEGGLSGHCAAERHTKCAHNWGGAHHGGHAGPSGYLTRRDATVVIDQDGHPMTLLPMHLWNCACICHREPTDLLGFIR